MFVFHKTTLSNSEEEIYNGSAQSRVSNVQREGILKKESYHSMLLLHTKCVQLVKKLNKNQTHVKALPKRPKEKLPHTFMAA